MFHKSQVKYAKLIAPICLILMVFFFGATTISWAQEVPADQDQEQGQTEAKPPEQDPSSPESGAYRTVDILQPEPVQSPANDMGQEELNPIPIPIQPTDDVQTLGGKTLIDDVFQNNRNPWGFSFSAYQAYTSDISSQSAPKQSSGISAFMTRLFFNAGRRKSKLHLDAGTGYRMYSRKSQSGSWDYNGNAQYSYDFSRRTSFQISDQFHSSYNDSWSFLSMYSPINYNHNFSNEILFNRQRITRNSIQVQVDHQLSRKAQIGIFAGHRWYKYSRNTLADSNAIELGGRLGLRLASWLQLSTRYSTYIHISDDAFRDTQVHRLELGEFDFQLSRSFRFWVGGGVDYSRTTGRNKFHENARAGISFTSEKSLITATYQRGLTSAIGLNRLLSTDVAAAHYGYRVTSWLNSNLQAYYYRSSEIGSNGVLKTLSGGGGLEFGLRKDLSLTLNAFYQDQQTSRFSIEGLNSNRFTGYIGIQYVWPARRRSGY